MFLWIFEIKTFLCKINKTQKLKKKLEQTINSFNF